MNRNFFYLIFFLLASVSVYSQEPQATPNNSSQTTEWARIESENKEISVALPKEFSYFFDKEGFIKPNPKRTSEKAVYTNVRSITAFQNGVSMFFESYDSKHGKAGRTFWAYNYPEITPKYISFDNFSGVEFVNEKPSHYIALYYLASDTNTYLIGVGARDKSNETLAKFLNAVKLNGKSVFTLKAAEKASEQEKPISITTLQETPFEIVDKLEKSEKKDEPIKSITTNVPNPTGLIPFFKPTPMYTDRARMENEQGTIAFRVEFGANGQISKIAVVDGLKYGLTENAVKAVRRIRFIPLEKNGAPVSAIKTVTYSFTIY